MEKLLAALKARGLNTTETDLATFLDDDDLSELTKMSDGEVEAIAFYIALKFAKIKRILLE